MTHTTTALGAAPEHTFLSTKAVFMRYGWGRTKGYEQLRSAGFPRSIGGMYRLDTLIAWEARVLAGELDQASEAPAAEPALEPSAPSAPQQQVADEAELPRRRRTRGANRKAAA